MAGLWMWTLVPLAAAQSPGVPSRQIPPSVQVEVAQLEHRFELALAADCDAERCFPKGCVWVDHRVADRPRSSSLPGLGSEAGPSPSDAQPYLTRASCAFAHEKSLASRDVQALVSRLEAKLTSGWTVVSVDTAVLPPIPEYLAEPPSEEPEEEPEEEVIEEEPEEAPAPPEWSWEVARQELWATLLPHFYWMIGLALVTFFGTLLIWSWRRVGQASLEEQALLAQLASPSGGGGGGPTAVQASEDPDDADFAEAQHAAWTERLSAAGGDTRDPALEALLRSLLRSGDTALLAKAVLTFPQLSSAMPTGGDVAEAKLALADFLTTGDPSGLPDDAAFYDALNREAVASSLSSQEDTEVLRSLRDDFGAAGLASLIGALPPREGAVLFALAPRASQQEMVRLMSPGQAAERSAQLLASNRVDRRLTASLFDVLEATRQQKPLPSMTGNTRITDRGALFDAAGALSVLLPAVAAGQRAALFDSLQQRFHGTLPAWHRDILVPAWLLALGTEARNDLFLSVEADGLAAWLSGVDVDTRGALVGTMPAALQTTIRALSSWASPAQREALAEQGRRALARGYTRQLARAGVPFERAVSSAPEKSEA